MKKIVKFEKIVPSGKALGRLENGKAVFCVGPLPGETVEVEITLDKKNYAEADMLRLVEPSKYRTSTPEDHYLACSPWQSVDYDHQLVLKQAIIEDAFSQYGLELKPPVVHGSPHKIGYRNKLDFALHLVNGSYRLAFHERGRKDAFIDLESGCRLGSERMNALALQVAAKLSEIGVQKAESLIVRRSSINAQLLIQVLVRAGEPVDYSKLQVKGLSALVVTLTARPPLMHGKVLHKSGIAELEEETNGIKLGYSFDSFFQTNVPAFSLTLQDITSSVSAGRAIVELYAGVGAIGLSLAPTAKTVAMYELQQASISCAKRNIKASHSRNVTAEVLGSDQLSAEMLDSVDTVVVDPPRAGLTGLLISTLLSARPQQIVYLSCDPVTLARDVKALSTGYGIKKVLAYDYYPGTPHVECLMILSRRA